MSIELEPIELGFERPFHHEVTRTLRIKNNNYDPVAFKVKTTAPKQYCVRPNSGRIEAGKDVEVQVLLQAMKEDPPAGYKCRDKFLVQSVAITADKEYNNVQHIWAYVEKNEKSAIQEKKIRVVFLDPGEKSTSNGGDAHDITFNYDQSPSSPPPYTSPTPSDEPATGTLPVGSLSKPESKLDGRSSTGDPIRSVPNPQFGSPSSGSSSHDLASQLAEAKATIARLQEQAQQQTLHERKALAIASDSKSHITEGTTGMSLTTYPPEGVSVQVCAALCLLAFLLAYLFF